MERKELELNLLCVCVKRGEDKNPKKCVKKEPSEMLTVVDRDHVLTDSCEFVFFWVFLVVFFPLIL